VFAGGEKLGEGNLGRPIQITDDRPRQREQNKNFDQEDSDDCRPKASATGWAVVGG
jgi:hypothetical protein